MTALTRGPLPARVYWRRRLLLLVVLLGLVVGVVRLTGLGSDPADDPQAQARQVSAESAQSSEETSAPSVTTTDTPSETRPETTAASGQPAVKTQGKRDRGPVLAEPEGVCSDRDVAVTPSVRDAAGGQPVTFTLELRTISTPACTWHVSPSTLTMKLTSGDDDIWSSQDCPRAIPTEDVVVRNNVATKVQVVWSAKRSDDDCNTRFTEWAMPGWYFVEASALAGEPSDLHFQLEKPEPGVVTKTVEPEPEKKADRKKKRSASEEQGRQGSRSDRNR